jgi:nucleoside-diphosphate-sugar epimerase
MPPNTPPAPRPNRPEQPAAARPDRPSAPAPTALSSASAALHDTSRPVLVLGATGGFGGAFTFEMLNSGRRVRLLVRDTKRAIARFGPFSKAEYVQGEVQNAALMQEAAAGCGAIVHAVNYPYSAWDPGMRTATEQVIAAARASGCTILFPGNVYALGPPPTWKAKKNSKPANPPLKEDAPNNPTTKKGRLRAEIEGTKDGRCRVLVLRAGDFFGPTVRNGLVDRVFGAAASGKPPTIMGKLDAPHQWVYVPDLAYAAVKLLDMSAKLRPFQVVNFAGYTLESQREFLTKVCAAPGLPARKAKAMPWVMLQAAAMFNPDAREVMELRYLFDDAVLLDGSLMSRLLPDFKPTPIEDAIEATLQSYRGQR